MRIEKPTSTKPGAKAIITQDGALSGWVGGSCAEPSVKKEALKALQEGSPRLLRLCPPEKMSGQDQYGVHEVKITCMSGGTLEIYLEPYLVQPHLLVVGHQALAEALVTLGKSLDYSVTVVGENLAPELFAQADRVVNSLDLSQINITPNTYVVIASHGNYDELALEAVLPSKAAYVALVASKKRSKAILSYLQMSRLQRSCYRLIWLNPLLGSAEYEPLTRGMYTALPFIDDFLPVHNLVSLEELAQRLQHIGKDRPARRQTSI